MADTALKDSLALQAIFPNGVSKRQDGTERRERDGAAFSTSLKKSSVPSDSPHLLLIDNYDSFTYNLVQYFGELGARLTVWRNDTFTLSDVRRLAPDAIVVSPGPCTPLEAGLSVDAVRELGPELPVLGVCLGHQSIGQAFGAQVGRARRPMHGKVSHIRHTGEGLFAGLPDDLPVTRYHSLVVRDLPPVLEATAWVTDPEEEVVMALKHRDYPIYGVQFHPESLETRGGMQMLENFLRIVRERGAA